MRDLARKFAAETKGSGSQFDPAPDRVLARYAVKGRIDFDCGKITGIKFEPLGIGQFSRIKASAPFRETPGAGADSNFLLTGKVEIPSSPMVFAARAGPVFDSNHRWCGRFSAR